MKIKLFVVYGGKSPEHEISLKTALTVLQALDESIYDIYPVYITREGLWCAVHKESAYGGWEADLLIAVPTRRDAASSIGELLLEQLALPGPKVVLPLLHGTNGEDGTIQGLLELLDMPYVGNGVLSAALTLDKAMSKVIAAQAGIPQTEYLVCAGTKWRERPEDVVDEAESKLGYPIYVKPASLGSSIGIRRCLNRSELLAGIRGALAYDSTIVLERERVAREIQVAVMGNDAPLASLPGEFIHDRDFFDFETKYKDRRLTMSIPAKLSPEITDRVRELALAAYRAHGCSGLARVDFFLDADERLYLNEINALPGFTNASMYPVMWERTDGTSYADLIGKLIEYALERHAGKSAIRFEK